MAGKPQLPQDVRLAVQLELRELVKEDGFHQRVVARKLGISPMSLSYALNEEKCLVSRRLLDKVLGYRGCSLEQLVSRHSFGIEATKRGKVDKVMVDGRKPA